MSLYPKPRSELEDRRCQQTRPRVTLMRLSCAGALALGTGCVFGCAATFPAGVVKNAEQAEAIAAVQCASEVGRRPPRWRARLTGHIWFVWQDEVQITVDARNGATEGCKVIVTSRDSGAGDAV